jgi:3'(2'), 5'-bisphosphate nucleotidase
VLAPPPPSKHHRRDRRERKSVTDEELAAQLAEGAGDLLLAMRARGEESGAALGLAGDRAANAFILAGLREWRPDDGLLSEESFDDRARLACKRVWIIDPLDGTREYAEGRPDWAVHVALAVDGVPVVGAVAVPATGRVYRSDRAAGAVAATRERPILLVSRTRPPEEAEAIARWIGADMVAMGSAGAKAMAVVAGEADVYYHAGGQHEWDNCAPAAVAIGAGLHASRVDGSALVYNRADTLVPDLLIARPALVARLLAFPGYK